jgi:membrane protein implicated in regulation of membrane protease activity
VEFLSSRMRFLLFIVSVALILTLIMELLNVELYFGGYYTRALVAIIIAIALYIAFEKISTKTGRPNHRNHRES